MYGSGRAQDQNPSRLDLIPNCPTESNIDRFLERTVEAVKSSLSSHAEALKSPSTTISYGVSYIPSLSTLQQARLTPPTVPSSYLASSLANLNLVSSSEAARQVALCKQRSRTTNKQLLNDVALSRPHATSHANTTHTNTANPLPPRASSLAPSSGVYTSSTTLNTASHTASSSSSSALTSSSTYSSFSAFSSYPSHSPAPAPAHPSDPTAAPAVIAAYSTPAANATSTAATSCASATDTATTNHIDGNALNMMGVSGNHVVKRTSDDNIYKHDDNVYKSDDKMDPRRTNGIGLGTTVNRIRQEEVVLVDNDDIQVQITPTNITKRDVNVYNRARNMYKRDDKAIASPMKTNQLLTHTLARSATATSTSMGISIGAVNDVAPASIESGKNDFGNNVNLRENVKSGFVDENPVAVNVSDMSVDDFLSRYVDNNDKLSTYNDKKPYVDNNDHIRKLDTLPFTTSTILPCDITDTHNDDVGGSSGLENGLGRSNFGGAGSGGVRDDAYGAYLDIESMYDDEDHHNRQSGYGNSSGNNGNNSGTVCSSGGGVAAVTSAYSATTATNATTATTGASVTGAGVGTAAGGGTGVTARRGLYRRAAPSSQLPPSSSQLSTHPSTTDVSNAYTSTRMPTSTFSTSFGSTYSSASSTSGPPPSTSTSTSTSASSFSSASASTAMASSALVSKRYEPTQIPRDMEDRKERQDEKEDEEDDGDLTDPAVLKRWQGTFPWTKDLMDLNLEHFGITQFRPLQQECINAVLSAKDVFILIPTGGGKSLCYQLATLAKRGFTVVVSPLVSLMEDQVRQLREASIDSALITAATSWEEAMAIRASAEEGRLQLLYLTPEKLANSSNMISWLKKMYDRNLFDMIAIDEAHCVSQWGHDFREDYLKLGMLRSHFPDISIMALTATATPAVIRSVVEVLGMRDCQIFRRSFNRSNLYYEVREKSGTNAKFIEEVAKYIKETHPKASGIIYCLSRKNCEDMAAGLRERGITAAHYHAEMKDEEKRLTQMLWTAGKPRVICATIAFGMGINKPDVRYVIHASMPKSMEGYYQESGRAGRDGLPADCILYYNGQDLKMLQSMLEKSHTGGRSKGNHSRYEADAIKRGNKDRLSRMYEFCKEQFECRRVMTLRYFDQEFSRKLCRGMCDNCCQSRASVEVDVAILACRLCRLLSQVYQRNPQHCTKTIVAALVMGKRPSSLAFLDKFGYGSLPDFSFGKGSKWGSSQFTTKHVDELLLACEREQLVCRTIKNKMILGKGINTVTEMLGVTGKGMEWVQSMETMGQTHDTDDSNPSSSSSGVIISSTVGMSSRVPGRKLVVKVVVSARTVAATKKQKEKEEKEKKDKEKKEREKLAASASPSAGVGVGGKTSRSARAKAAAGTATAAIDVEADKGGVGTSAAGTGVAGRGGLYSRVKARAVSTNVTNTTASGAIADNDNSMSSAASSTGVDLGMYRRIGATIAMDDEDDYTTTTLTSASGSGSAARAGSRAGTAAAAGDAGSRGDVFDDEDDDGGMGGFRVELVTGSQLARERGAHDEEDVVNIAGYGSSHQGSGSGLGVGKGRQANVMDTGRALDPSAAAGVDPAMGMSVDSAEGEFEVEDEDEEEEHDANNIFDMLMTLNQQIVAAVGVGPLNYEAMTHLKQTLPTTMDALARTPKIGRAKANKYGKLILCVICQYVHDKNPGEFVIPEIYQFSKIPEYLEELKRGTATKEVKASVGGSVDLVQMRKRNNVAGSSGSSSAGDTGNDSSITNSGGIGAGIRASSGVNNLSATNTHATGDTVDEDGFFRPKPHFPENTRASGSTGSGLAKYGFIPDSMDVSPSKYPFIDVRTGQQYFSPQKRTSAPTQTSSSSSPYSSSASSATLGATTGAGSSTGSGTGADAGVSWLSGLSTPTKSVLTPSKTLQMPASCVGAGVLGSGNKRPADPSGFGSAEKRQKLG